jgi:hypothetical protein
MNYNTFFNSHAYVNKPVLIPAASYQHITGSESASQHYSGDGFTRFTTDIGGLRDKINISSFLPMETSNVVWTTLVGLAVPVLCYAGYKFWKWVIKVQDENKQEPYEYWYIKELDEMMQTKLDDLQNPEMADMDTIRVGKYVFPLSLFNSFKRNFRKRLIRKTDEMPIVKRVPVPAEEFDWKYSFVEEFVPNGGIRNANTIQTDIDDSIDNSGNMLGKRVLMRYEPETESFWWYSDSSSIQYKYLETVARKYVYDFNRLDVFIDIREELKKGADEAKKRNEKGEGEGDGDVSDKKSMNERKIYAKFKRYNKKSARVDPGLGNKKMIIKAKANRYSYKGKLCEYDKLINDKNAIVGGDNKEHDVENVSWSEWKKINFDYWK